MYQIAANMQTVTLVLVTPVLQAAHWLIRKQVHSGDQPLHPLHRWARLITGALAPLPEISLANDCIKGSLGHHVQVCTHTSPGVPGLHLAEPSVIIRQATLV